MKIENSQDSFMMIQTKAKELMGNDDEFEISFQDIENETIEIFDEHDWEYLVSNAQQKSDMKIEVKKKPK